MRFRTHILAFIAAIAPLRAESPRIEWQRETLRLIERGATYGRMARLRDGAILCCYQRGRVSWTRRSEDGGCTWSAPAEAARCAFGVAANPELCALADGRVLLLYNERPQPENGTAHYTIRLATSTDGGRSWQGRAEPLFIAGTTERTGCWEPAAVQMPDGEVRLFFANESFAADDYAQEILLITSRDAGATWNTPRRVSFRPERRDGMPVPAILADGRLVFSIEDNGIAGQQREHPPFRPTIVASDTGERWLALASSPPDACNVAAPYLARLPGGTTLLSAQSTEDDRRFRHMVVYIGDATARNFAQRTLPFGSSAGVDCWWNSLFVKDARTVVALSDTTIDGQRGLWCIEGHVTQNPK